MKIDKNWSCRTTTGGWQWHWGHAMKKSPKWTMVGGVGGRTDGGMCGQLLEGDGSPRWVDDDPKQVHACAKTRKLRKKSPKWTMVGGGDQIGACVRKN